VPARNEFTSPTATANYEIVNDIYLKVGFQLHTINNYHYGN